MAVMSRRPLIAGNWKMNGLQRSVAEFEKVISGSGDLAAKADLLVCPPATLVAHLCRGGAGLAGGDRGAGLPRGSQRARSPGTFRPRCSRTRALLPSSSAIPNGGPCIRKPTRRCAPRRSRHGVPGLMAIVCIGETRARTGSKAHARCDRPPARRLTAGRRNGRQSGGGL